MKRTDKHYKSRKDSSRDMDQSHHKKQDNIKTRRADKYGVAILLEEEIKEHEENYDQDS